MAEKIDNIPKIKKAVITILSRTTRTSKDIQRLSEIVKYKDALFYVWKIFTKKFIADKCSDNIYILNVVELLENITPPKNLADSESDEMLLPSQNENKKFILDVQILRKFIGKVWISLVNRDLSPAVHKKIMFLLLESYLKEMSNPVFLTDYLMASMNVKGITSILALEGISQLMQKHNIEYPNIYGKLYTMFEPDIFHKKYKSRLFYLADIFLSSIYLPESIVASFAKKTARLSLNASASDIPLILRFIGNLLIRHPGLKSMIHHNDDLEMTGDPFLPDEKDPSKTRAAKSSLWEISLLKKHCLPSVSSAARFIDCNLPSIEYDLSEVLSRDCKDVFESEAKKKNSEKPCLTYERPQNSIARLKDDKVFKLWSLT